MRRRRVLPWAPIPVKPPAGTRMAKQWSALSPRFLPFADAASAELPMGRLLRLSLFQVTVGMAVVLLHRHAQPGHDRRARGSGLGSSP